jgi:murein DD-endopeptidase MepM/ murein hydrolase activator NlpD
MTNKFEWHRPIKPTKVNQPFGANANPFYKEMGMLGHNGIDYSAYHGQIVRAAHEGVVTFAGEDGSGGTGVVIRTNALFEYKDTETHFKTIYWHLIPQIPVKVGTQVKIGDIIGYADNTGMSTGTHLHFGLKPLQKGEQDWQWYNLEQDNGYKGAIDPRPYFSGLYAEDFRNIWDKIIELKQKVELLIQKNKR